MFEKDLKITRSEYLKGKTALTDEDIISLLDLPPEKVAANIETYTEKLLQNFQTKRKYKRFEIYRDFIFTYRT